jgi:hypothetical protein
MSIVVLGSKSVLVEQIAQAFIQGRKLGAMLSDKHKDAMRGQHASQATSKRHPGSKLL